MTQDEDCLKRLAELEEENDHLRDAAEGFGQLAERLSAQLRAEREAGGDVRPNTSNRGDRSPDSGAG